MKRDAKLFTAAAIILFLVLLAFMIISNRPEEATEAACSKKVLPGIKAEIITNWNWKREKSSLKEKKTHEEKRNITGRNADGADHCSADGCNEQIAGNAGGSCRG